MSKLFPGLSVGRIVHYVLEDGQHRPAIVVRVWDGLSPELLSRGYCNVAVVLDGSNDWGNMPALGGGLLAWRTSVVFDDSHKPGTLHWPERVEGDVEQYQFTTAAPVEPAA